MSKLADAFSPHVLGLVSLLVSAISLFISEEARRIAKRKKPEEPEIPGVIKNYLRPVCGPWRIKRYSRRSDGTWGCVEVCDTYGDVVCVVSVRPSQGANALLIRMSPEMYESLVDATYNFCFKCISNSFAGVEMPGVSEFAFMGCIKSESAMPNCPARKWHEILRKVRGEA